MENIYSTKKFQELTEIEELTPIHFTLKDEDNNPQFDIFGLLKGKDVSYGIYAPFWFPKNILKHADLIIFERFILNLISSHNEKGYQSIKIRLPPSFYAPLSLNAFKFILIKNGFMLSNTALYQTLKIKDFKSKSSYQDSLKYSSRKEIRKFSELYKFILRELDIRDEAAIKNSYNIINLNRKKLGTSLKYSINYLLNLAHLEPDKIKIFDFLVEDEVVASAICHETDQKILYVAAWGDTEHNLNKSPMYIFASELVEYCIKKNYDYLDFGISSDLNLFTPNLYKFKENLGCFSSLQETLFLKLV